MENSLQIFKNEDFGKIRGVMIDGVPYFVGKDVAEALGYKKARNALKEHVDEEDALKWGVPTNSGVQLMTLINESGLYSLILTSKLPTAKQFKRWVTSEVLPAIRKTGAYSADKDYQKWLETRQHGKISRRAETDAIKNFIDYAKMQGCTWEDGYFYKKISVLCNVGAGIPPKNGRDTASIHQLNIIDLLEGSVIKNILRNGIIEGIHYTQIWAKVQQQIDIFLEITFQDQKFLK